MQHAISSAEHTCAQRHPSPAPGDITSSTWGCVPPPKPAGLPAIRQTMKLIAEEVAEKHGIRVDDLRGQSRKRIFSHPRQEFMWRARRIFRSDGSFRYSSPQIGMFLDGRDHSTVLHGAKRHEHRLKIAARLAISADNAASALIHGGE